MVIKFFNLIFFNLILLYCSTIYSSQIYDYQTEKCIEKNFTETLKDCINSEKILNDWYRYEFLDARDLIDKHDFTLIKKI